MKKKKIIKTNKASGGEVDLYINLPIKYDLFQKVFFFLANSIEIHDGRVVGFFVVAEDRVKNKKLDDRYYMYQVEYYRTDASGGRTSNMATVREDELTTDRSNIEKVFNNIRIKRIKELISDCKIELSGAKTNKAYHKEREEYSKKELIRLKGLLLIGGKRK